MNNRQPTPTPSPAKAPGRNTAPIKLLIADDQYFIREGLAACLNQRPTLQVVGAAADGLEALAKAKELLPDVALLDIEMPHLSGMAAAEALRRDLPNTKVLIFSIHQDPMYVSRVLNSGACGYILKVASVAEIVAAIDKVMSGDIYFSPAITRTALNCCVQGNGNATTPRTGA